MEDFKDLRVWQKAHELTLNVYRKSATFPKEEMYGLTSQTSAGDSFDRREHRRGCGRRSDPEMRRFLQIATGSANELESVLWKLQRMLAVSGYSGFRLMQWQEASSAKAEAGSFLQNLLPPPHSC